MRRSTIILAALATLGLTACNGSEDRVLFDGLAFKSKAKKEADDLAVFLVSVAPVSQSLDGARAAASYEATRYCIANFGNSNVIWLLGPDTPAENLRVEKDTLVFKGKCDP